MGTVATVIGLAGVALVLLAYGLFAAHRLKSDDWRYPVLNIIGTCGILYSLFYQYNLPSIVAQVTWMILSLAGLVRIARDKHRG